MSFIQSHSYIIETVFQKKKKKQSRRQFKNEDEEVQCTFGKYDADENSEARDTEHVVQSPRRQAHGGDSLSDAVTPLLETNEGGYSNSRG